MPVATSSLTKVTQVDPAKIEVIRSRLLGYSPEQFEHVIKDLLIQTGFDRVTVTKFCQDGGIDINAFTSSKMWPITNLMIQIQAKRWLHTVGRKEIAELRGSLKPFARGCVVTTSHFSRAAIAEAYESGKNPVNLMDGFELSSLIDKLNLNLL